MGRLMSAAKKNDTEAMYKAIRNELAERCDECESTRDFAAMCKSLIDVTDKLGRLNGQVVDGRKKTTQSHHTSPLDQARSSHRNLRVVNG